MEPTPAQLRILQQIQAFWNNHGYAPAVRDLMALCGFRSPRAVSFHLDNLEKHGWIERDGQARARSIRLKRNVHPLPGIPIFGAVPAGPAAAQDEIALGTVPLPSAPAGATSADLFAVRVQGDSMVDAGIHDGDTAIVQRKSPKPNDIVVALVDGQVTLKRLVRRDGTFLLKAENPRYADIVPIDELQVQGVVTAIYRTL